MEIFIIVILAIFLFVSLVANVYFVFAANRFAFFINTLDIVLRQIFKVSFYTINYLTEFQKHYKEISTNMEPTLDEFINVLKTLNRDLTLTIDTINVFKDVRKVKEAFQNEINLANNNETNTTK